MTEGLFFLQTAYHRKTPSSLFSFHLHQLYERLLLPAITQLQLERRRTNCTREEI